MILTWTQTAGPSHRWRRGQRTDRARIQGTRWGRITEDTVQCRSCRNGEEGTDLKSMKSIKSLGLGNLLDWVAEESSRWVPQLW